MYYRENINSKQYEKYVFFYNDYGINFSCLEDAKSHQSLG